MNKCCQWLQKLPGRSGALAFGLLCCMQMAMAADTIVINGHIYTGNRAEPWAEALAITAGRIDAVGSTADIQQQKRADTRVIDLDGRTVIPGIIDSHAHTLYGSMVLHGLNLSTPDSSVWPDESEKFVQLLRDYAEQHPHDKVLFARANFDADAAVTSYQLLDQAAADRPLIVHGWNEHELWLNTPALKLAKITSKPLPDALEESGVMRDAAGRPTGVVAEAAMARVHQAVLKAVPRQQQLQMVRSGIAYLNQFGITTVVNATGSLEEMALYGSLRDDGKLTVRMRNSIGSVGVKLRLSPQLFRQLDSARRRYNDEWLSANLVKLFADGAGKAHHAYTAEEFVALITELDRRGYQLMTHALMPDSIHAVLDAYASLAQHNGARDRRLRIEHAILVTDQDLPRFAAQSVIASMQPAFCCNAPIPGFPVQDRWHSLLASGTVLAFGSDWPCSWPPNPFFAVSQAVTRSVWSGRQAVGAGQAGRVPTGASNTPAESTTVVEAIDAFTRGGAYAAFMDHSIGTLEVGKLADLVVLSADIFSVPTAQIANITATMTMVGGQIVFQSAMP